jgi:phosphopantothenoylcysteine decarboxylase/phosphopantothenate--cysteine ligase
MHPSDDIKGLKSNLLLNKKIIIGITGSISAVEDIKLCRELIRHGAEIIPVMSKSATKIIHPDSIEFSTGKKPILELTGKTEHVFYCGKGKDKADLLIISPCTANTISKISKGIDDNPITTFASTAIGSKIPIIIVPAMHISMYEHKIIQKNINDLKENGIKFIEPNIQGNKAKLPDIDEIVSRIIRTIGKNDYRNKKILIIGGSNSEPIDDVRLLTNRSSGKTAISLTKNSFLRGGEVELWYGNSIEKYPNFIKTLRFNTINHLIQLIKSNNIKKYDIIILCAALSDYTIEKKQGKIKSDKEKLLIELKKTPKIISIIRKKAPNSIIVGFKLCDNKNNVIKEAENLLTNNKLNFVVGNTISAINSEKNKIWIIDKNKKNIELNGNKIDITNKILDKINK